MSTHKRCWDCLVATTGKLTWVQMPKTNFLINVCKKCAKKYKKEDNV